MQICYNTTKRQLHSMDKHAYVGTPYNRRLILSITFLLLQKPYQNKDGGR